MKRFWDKVRKTQGCWEWCASKSSGGYGTFRIARKSVAAHRMAWHLINGDIPIGLCVLHKCDNKACVKPSHLFLGTQQDNIEDMVKKGRSRRCGNATVDIRGEQNWNADLTENEIKEIREAYARGVRQQVLAETYQTTQSNISHIVRRVNWAHVQ